MDSYVHFELATVVILSFVLIAFYRQKHLKTYKNKIFRFLLVLAIFSEFLDAFRVIHLDSVIKENIKLFYVLQSLHIMCYTIYCLAFCTYLLAVMCHLLIGEKKAQYMLFGPICLVLAMCLINPRTQILFYRDYAGDFQFGNFFYVPPIISLIYLITPLIMLRYYQWEIKTREEKGVFFAMGLLFLGIFFQFFFHVDIFLCYVVNALVIFFLFLFFQNSDYYLDEVTGFFKMHGFEEVARERLFYQKNTSFVLLRIENYHSMEEMYGDEKLTKVQEKMSDFMREHLGKKDYYHIAASTFAIIFENEGEAKKAYRILNNNMPTEWNIEDENVVQKYRYYIVNTPVDCDDFNELMQRINYARSDYKGHHKAGELINLTHETVELVEKRQMVADLIEQTVMDNSIEIYFQPIYSLHENRIVSLEVLSRLKDRDKNFINPEFFIHVAEETRDIIQLGEQIFRKSCIFVSQNHLFERGIEDININLSPVQCCYNSMAEDLIQIAQEYQIPMKRLHMEITESGIMDKPEILETLQKLRDAGSKISLDDFGTGYSNISSILRLPIDYVKIDKSLVWSYDRGENKYLDQLVPMIHSQGKKIISEGIETTEHIDIFKRLEGDLLQGYYFAKPLPEREFLLFLDEQEKKTVVE